VLALKSLVTAIVWLMAWIIGGLLANIVNVLTIEFLVRPPLAGKSHFYASSVLLGYAISIAGAVWCSVTIWKSDEW
jgi:hypothetical protein